MGDKFSAIKIGSLFTASDGERYKKTSELTYDDMYGLEHYIDPFFDKKINAPENVQPLVDTRAHIIKDGKEEKFELQPVKPVKAKKKVKSKKK